MEKQKFKPMLISIDVHKQRNYDTQKTSFLAILSDFWNEAEQFIQVKNIKHILNLGIMIFIG